jgi:F-type H+-transporting ATPase subunit b
MRVVKHHLTALGTLCLVVLAPAALRADEATAKPRYRANVHTKDGEKQLKFDLTKERDAEQLLAELKQGHVHELKLDKPPNLLGLKWDLGLWSIIVFLALLIILGKFAWPKMLEGLQRREANIRGAIVEAEKAREEANQARAEFQAMLAQGSEKVREMLEEARRDAQAASEQMKQDARRDIQDERDRLKREILTAKDQAVQELWNQTAQLATLISTKALRRQMTAEDHKRLMEEALAEFKESGTEQYRRVAQLARS